MEAITRLVAESLARYGFDRPVDYRRLQWSRWFRCESLHSLLYVPSKPGVFALAEEVMDLGAGKPHMATAALGRPAEQGSAAVSPTKPLGGAALESCDPPPPRNAALAAEEQRRMLAVLQFCEDEDMAFVLDRMLSRQNPMSARLASGRCFVRFVVIEDQSQRRSICGALNQWLISSGEKAFGIGAHFATSLELSPLSVARASSPTNAGGAGPFAPVKSQEEKADGPPVPPPMSAAQLDSGTVANFPCPQSIPSGF